jgi:hypothetical protein
MKNLSFFSIDCLIHNAKNFGIVFTLFFLFSNGAVSQQWLFFPEDISQNWVDIGDLDVEGNQITVEALISTTQPQQADAYNILSKHRFFSDANYLLRAGSFQITTSNGFVSLENPVILCADSVYHVAGTYDGDSVKYFVNGNQVASAHWTGDLILNDYTASIGNRSLDPTEQFHGYIDEVRIWNVARSGDEIANNMYQLPDPQQQTGLLAYYQFEGNFDNIQGNTLWNGTAVGTDFYLSENMYFEGSVSTHFCTPSGFGEAALVSDLDFFPNPSANTINFSKDVERVRIYNQFGVLVIDKELINNTLSVAHLAKGVYVVAVVSGENNIIWKKLLIKE